jgi:hypothetical protein
MLRQEVVLIEAPATLPVVRADLESLLMVSAVDVGDGVRFDTGGAVVRLRPNDYVDEPGLALAGYAVVIDVEGEEREATARQIFTHFAELSHPLWMRDEGRIVARQWVPA